MWRGGTDRSRINGNSINVVVRALTHSDRPNLLVCEGSTKKVLLITKRLSFFSRYAAPNRHLGGTGCRSPRLFLRPLCLHLEGHTDLVSALVEVLAVDDRRQSEGDT